MVWPESSANAALSKAYKGKLPSQAQRLTAGAVASLVIVGWLVVLAIAFLQRDDHKGAKLHSSN
jgi:hypothetical protein